MPTYYCEGDEHKDGSTFEAPNDAAALDVAKLWAEAHGDKLLMVYTDNKSSSGWVQFRVIYDATEKLECLIEFLKVAAEKWPSAVEPAKDVEAERFAIAMQVLKEETEKPLSRKAKEDAEDAANIQLAVEMTEEKK